MYTLHIYLYALLFSYSDSCDAYSVMMSRYYIYIYYDTAYFSLYYDYAMYKADYSVTRK